MDLGHDIFAIDEDRSALRRAQSHMQDGAILGEVDPFAPEHGVDPLIQATIAGQLQKQLECFVGDPVLRVIEEQAQGLDRHALAALGIIGKQLAQVQVADLLHDGLSGPATRGVW